MAEPAAIADELNRVRERIDAIDMEILRLISDRARCAQEVGRIKNAVLASPEGGKDAGTVQYYRPEREAAILRRIKQDNPGPLDGEEVARLFREIMSACLALEQPIKAAYLGPEGTFTQAAALKQFGHSVRTIAMATIADIFREVESGSCDFGVVPVENSTEGVISHTLDLFLSSSLMIAGEVSLRIHHHLMSRGGRAGRYQGPLLPSAVPGPVPGLAGSPFAPRGADRGGEQRGGGAPGVLGGGERRGGRSAGGRDLRA